MSSPAGSIPAIVGALHANPAAVPIIPFLRAVGSHLIVWHHVARYGPASEFAYELAPGVFDWLNEYARMAVQVFFVLGGYVTARKLIRPMRWTPRVLGGEILARYRRIGIPYFAVLVIALVANHVARQAISRESIAAPTSQQLVAKMVTPPPSVWQMMAHAVFMQDLLGYDSPTVGLWYLAIDFQLGLLVLLVLAACQIVFGGDGRQPERGFRAAQWVFWTLAATSLLWLNRCKECDVFALYFFGSYFGGMVTAWVVEKRLPRTALWAYAGLVGASLAVDWRLRPAVALATGLAVVLSHSASTWNFGAHLPSGAAGLVTILSGAVRRLRHGAWGSVVNFWSERSYSLFLIHFPVCLVTFAVLAEHVDERPAAALGVLFLEYALSLIAAILFYHYVERQIPRWLASRSAGRATPAVSNSAA